MSHLNRHVKAPGRQSGKDGAEVSENAGSVGQAVADGVHAVGHDVQVAAGRVMEAVEEKCEQAGQAARDSFEQGRDRVRHWENGLKADVRSRPVASLLIAAGIGVVLGALWRRRRS